MDVRVFLAVSCLAFCIVWMVTPLDAQIVTILKPTEDEIAAAKIRKWALWVGGGAREETWNLEIGFRYKFFGVSFGCPDMKWGSGVELPKYNPGWYPDTNKVTESFPQTSASANLYGFYDVNAAFALYTSVGYVMRVYTVLDRSTATGNYFASLNMAKYEGIGLAVGAGIQCTLFDLLAVGCGYNSRTGPQIHLGVRL